MPHFDSPERPSEEVFDPKIHLDYSSPTKVYPLADLKLEPREFSTPIAATAPFQLLTEEGVLAYRRALFAPEVLDECAVSPYPNTLIVRDAAKKSKFLHDFWNHPETLNILSGLMQAPLVPIFKIEEGFVSVQTNSAKDLEEMKKEISIEPDHRLIEMSEEEKNANPLESGSIIPWHFDSYPYACIIMLSHTDGMIGGETFIKCGDGTITKVEGPKYGCAYIIQGGILEHLASRAKGVKERIASVASFRANVDGFYDISFTTNTRPMTNTRDLHREWAEYRLKVLKKEIEATLERVRNNQISTEDFHIFGKRQVGYMQQTYRQMVPHGLIDQTIENHGNYGYYHADRIWENIRKCDGFETLLAAAREMEDTWDPARDYQGDLIASRLSLKRGKVLQGQLGRVIPSANPWQEYSMGDELLRQGQRELFLGWSDYFGFSSLVTLDTSAVVVSVTDEAWRQIYHRMFTMQDKTEQVKCDETHPVCLNCAKRKSDCTYKSKYQWCTVVTPETQDHPEPRERENQQDHPSATAPGCDQDAMQQAKLANSSSLAAVHSNEHIELYGAALDTMLESWNAETTCAWIPPDPISVWQMSLGTFTAQVPSSRDTELIDFYLDKVAPLFCCYAASDKNPFYHLIAKAWNSEHKFTKYAAVIRASQSLAAVFMSARESSLRSVAKSLQKEAQGHIDYLSSTEGYDAMTFLALHLLGASAMYSQDVAYWHVVAAKLQNILSLDALGSNNQTTIIRLHERERQFFWGLHMYNHLHTTFVENHLSLPSIQIPERYLEDITGIRRYPHPYTGVSSHITFALLTVGKLIKRQRKLAVSRSFATEQQIQDIRALISEANELETMLLAQNVPGPEEIEDPNDEVTPVEHLVKMAECHRNAALLQLYRVFPDVLRRRLGLDGIPISTEGFTLRLALRILDTLTSIPSQSGTTPFQTVLLLAMSSELKFASHVPDMDQTSHDIRIANAREWTVTRLSEAQCKIPGQRLYTLLKKVRRMWAQLDVAGPFDVVFWLDYMM
ncbi:hypothetical protein KCU95_g407, partial [Aureobasidium melanogenum]